MGKEQSPVISARLLASVDRGVWPPGALITGVLNVTDAAADSRLVLGTGSPAVDTLPRRKERQPATSTDPTAERVDASTSDPDNAGIPGVS